MALEFESAKVVAEVEPEGPPRPPPPAPAGEPFSRVLGELGGRVDRGEGLMDGVASGRWSSSDPGTLIALQAGIYRYSEAVDLVGKLVDRGGNAVRTVLHGGQ